MADQLQFCKKKLGRGTAASHGKETRVCLCKLLVGISSGNINTVILHLPENQTNLCASAHVSLCGAVMAASPGPPCLGGLTVLCKRGALSCPGFPQGWLHRVLHHWHMSILSELYGEPQKGYYSKRHRVEERGIITTLNSVFRRAISKGK